MAVDASTLVARYPEFVAAVSAQPDMVDACIAQAVTQIDRTVYGSAKADAATHALAAHFIAICPLDGELGRLNQRSDKTIYWLQYEQIKRSLGLAAMVV